MARRRTVRIRISNELFGPFSVSVEGEKVYQLDDSQTLQKEYVTLLDFDEPRSDPETASVKSLQVFLQKDDVKRRSHQPLRRSTPNSQEGPH